MALTQAAIKARILAAQVAVEGAAADAGAADDAADAMATAIFEILTIDAKANVTSGSSTGQYPIV